MHWKMCFECIKALFWGVCRGKAFSVKLICFGITHMAIHIQPGDYRTLTHRWGVVLEGERGEGL